MIDEKDVSSEERWQFEQLALKCLQNLKKANLNGHYFPTRGEARNYILEAIPMNAVVGFGDSVTLHQIGVLEELEDRGQKIVSPFWKDSKPHFPPTRREVVQVGREALFADYFLSGINAITLDGKIVNTDGMGNRLAGIMFGPRRVILVAGVNKLVSDVDEAMQRIKKIAAPLNARRHRSKHGVENGSACGRTGECVDCRNARICCYTLIIEHQNRDRIEVVLVGERLGL